MFRGMNEKKPSEVEKNAELKVNLAKPYLREFHCIKTDKEANEWVKSIPEGLERTLLLLLALNCVKDGV